MLDYQGVTLPDGTCACFHCMRRVVGYTYISKNTYGASLQVGQNCETNSTYFQHFFARYRARAQIKNLIQLLDDYDLEKINRD